MSSSPSSSQLDADHDYQDELANFIAELSMQPDKENVVSEIAGVGSIILQSIYGDNAIRLWHPPKDQTSRTNHSRNSPDLENIRYEVEVSLPPPHEDISIRVLVSLPPTYPASSPPQLQLLSKYIGAFGADSNLFGSILRTFISMNGVEFSPDSVCVFDGLQNVSERCASWYEDHLSAEKAGELLREDAKEHRLQATSGQNTPLHENPPQIEVTPDTGPLNALPDGVRFFIAEPIIDRKSSFIGRACYISHPSQVPHVLSHLMSDRRIAKAAHPIINAWRCQVDGVLHQDNDDDGETAAGGRLAHLLQILEVNNVLVVVTRYFGGIHLGPDRFKHINQAGRNALEQGGFLDAPDAKKVGRGRK